MIDLHALLLRWFTALVDFLPNLFLIALILLLTRVIARRVEGFIGRLTSRTFAPREVSNILGRSAHIAVLLIGALLVLGQLGLTSAVMSFVAGLGIAGIIIGFALQDIVKHFAAGILLLMLRPFRIGDQVRIGSFVGHVEDVQLRATIIRTVEGNEVLIPNADVYNSAIVNQTRHALHRHVLDLQLTKEQSFEQAQGLLIQAVSSIPGVAQNPAPQVLATALATQQITVQLHYWIDEHATAPETTTTAVIVAVQRVLAGLS
jgi:small conductance mechanosensitive channel